MNAPLVKMQFWIKTNDFQNFNIVNLNKNRKSDKQFTSLSYDDVQLNQLI